MKIYMNNENQELMIPKIIELITNRVDEEPVTLIVDGVLTEDTKNKLAKLPPQTLTVTTMFTPYVSNLSLIHI